MRPIHLLLLLLSVQALAQPTDMNKAEDGKFAPYMGQAFVQYINTDDTLFCDKVELWMKGQEVIEVAYTVDGKKTTLKGKDVLKLERFYAEDKVLMELLPLNPEKPDKKQQHLFKNLKGYFTVWTNNHSVLFNLQQFNWGGNMQAFPTTIEMMSMEGGPIFKVSKKIIHEKIDPIIDECKGVQGTEVSGFLDINYMELTDRCYDYNRLCAPEYK
ncbi:MAG: hypothetical protein H6603_04705 [Flavobacteriales bacterium]|nr:hypothetical protein [Flavobacteriales bacterium]MCB9191255.1 hypothetical protein [Flavobacteriales bacterium]MCB9204260.1 hypothetical protein [Flavobacteriales bacterium]